MKYLVKTKVFVAGVLHKKGEVVDLDPKTIEDDARHVVPFTPQALTEAADEKVPDQGQGPKRKGTNKVPPAPGSTAEVKKLAEGAQASGDVTVQEGGQSRATTQTDNSEKPTEIAETVDGITLEHTGGGYYTLTGEGVPEGLDKVKGKEAAAEKRDELIALR